MRYDREDKCDLCLGSDKAFIEKKDRTKLVLNINETLLK